MPPDRPPSDASPIWPWITALAIVAAGLAVGLAVTGREGNLAFDDADYLRRGLELARRVADEGPRGFARLLDERPKPPWLVGWIGLTAAVVGRDRLPAVLALATAWPYAMLLAATAALAARGIGRRAALPAVLAVLASPMGLSLGARVMVETWLSLWTLVALATFALLLTRPSPARAAAFGAAVGLAALTKSTIVLFLAGPLVWAAASGSLARSARLVRASGRSRAVLLALTLPALVVAGPWYARHALETLRFARGVSQFEEVRGGPGAAGLTRLSRLTSLAGEVAGWPLVAAMPLALLAIRRGPRDGDDSDPAADRDRERATFARATLAAVVGAVALGLIPGFFGHRYWLPLWPAAALVLVGAWARAAEARGRAVLWPVAAALLLGVGLSGRGLAREERTATCWAARDLIDHLVERHRVHTLATLGKWRDWNVNKTGLVNETRRTPDDCFVLFELSKLPPARAVEQAEQFDAVLVLDPAAIPAGYRAASPGQNRAYPAVEALVASGRFVPIDVPTPGLPPLRVLLRRDHLALP